MMGLRTKLAICMAKLTHWIVRILHCGDGVVLPGYIARKIDPDILRVLSGMMRKKIIVVMGTNGKTTTNSILNHVLTEEGRQVIINRTGANMRNGITGAFVLAAGLRGGQLRADYACIEVDENASVSILPELRPECIVLTNIFRDQLDRYGEVDIVRNRLKAAVSAVPDAKLVLNSDDVISYSLSYECKNPVITYGINEQIFDHRAGTGSRESIFCRLCGNRLEYDTIYYGQSGIWHCPGCGAGRPEPSYGAENVTLYNRTYSFDINGMTVNTKARAPYNVYNTLAACAALRSIGEGAQFAGAIGSFDYGNNREDIFHIHGACIQLHLAKNPAGFQQKLSLILQDKKQKDIIIQINDTAQDGKDISWLWDVDFQMLAAARASCISIGGTRRHDMGLRLKYEDIPHTFTINMKDEIQRLARTGTGNLYVIVNYSGLSELRRLLISLQKEQGSKAARLIRQTQCQGQNIFTL